MKTQSITLAVLATLGCLGNTAQAQDGYIGLGLPGLYTLGYSYPLSNTVGLRAEYTGGLSVNRDGNQDGVNYTGSIKASRVGAFADWFPLGGSFRLVGGLTFNDVKADFNAIGSGTATINGNTVNMSGETYNVRLKFPTTTPYLGIGFGHQKSDVKGWGFYGDLGVMIGTFNIDTTTSLVSSGKATQADVDAQSQKFRDALGGLSVLPSASVGLLYRY